MRPRTSLRVVERVEERPHREERDERPADDHEGQEQDEGEAGDVFSRSSGIQWIRVRPRKPSS